MHAEITFECRNDLPANLEAALAERFSKTVSKKAAMAATIWKSSSDFEDQIVYWHVASQLVFLVYKPDARTLKVHVENKGDKANLRLLKKHIEETNRKFEQFLRQHRNRSTRVEVTIWAEETDFQSGYRQSWLDRFWRSVIGNIGTEVYVPVVAFVVSLALQYQVVEAAVNAGAALLAAAVWIGISVTFTKETFLYAEDIRL